jgi:hypothetical protein
MKSLLLAVVLFASALPSPGASADPPAPPPALVAPVPPSPLRPTAVIVDDGSCAGWGLTAPLFGISNRGVDSNGARNQVLITGPIQAGVGGGYFSAFNKNCKTLAVGWEAFAYSEGLNPADTFQLGVAGGISLNVWKQFSFGLAVGMDMIRRQTVTSNMLTNTYLNGVLIGNDGNFARHDILNNFTWLITFNIIGAAGQATANAH